MAIVLNKKKPEMPEAPPAPKGKIVIKSKLDVSGHQIKSVKETKYYFSIINKHTLVRDKVKVTRQNGDAFVGVICAMGTDNRPATKLTNFELASIDVKTGGGKIYTDIYPDTDKVEIIG